MSFRKKESDPKGTCKKQQELLRNKATKHIGKAKKVYNIKRIPNLLV